MEEDKCCSPQEGPFIESLRGNVPATAFALDLAAQEAEETPLTDGVVAYHYFEGPRLESRTGLPLWKVIAKERRIGSRAMCLSSLQIIASVRNATFREPPHYGDGAYCTFHHSFPTAHDTVAIARGKIPAQNLYQAVLVIRDAAGFHKFPYTGGVVRSIPREPLLRTGQLVTIGEDTGEARLLRVEQYDGSRWIRVRLHGEG